MEDNFEMLRQKTYQFFYVSRGNSVARFDLLESVECLATSTRNRRPPKLHPMLTLNWHVPVHTYDIILYGVKVWRRLVYTKFFKSTLTFSVVHLEKLDFGK